MLWRNLLPLLSVLVFSCYGSETPTQIFSRLMKNYSRNESPGFPDKPTEVKLSIYVINLQYLGDESSDFMICMYLRQAWKDPRLSFSTTDGKTNQIQFPEDSWKQIWVPDTFVRGARKVKVDDDMASSRLLRVKPDGQVFYVMKVSMVVPSRFNLQRFPFDKQQVELNFESFGYQTEQLHFSVLTSAPIDVTRHLSISQFRTTGVSSEDCSMNYTYGAFPCLRMAISVERRSCQFFLQFYLPSTLIVILSWLAFWIDPDTSSPSRLLTGILSFLALILLDTVVGHSPFTADYKTALDCWVIACYVFVFGTLVQFAVVNILSKKPSGTRGLEYLKPPFPGAEKASEANEKLVDGSVGEGKRMTRLVDWFSRIVFPMAFLLFNVIYWIIVRA